MALVVPLAAGFAAGLAIWSVLATVFSEEREVSRRLARLSAFEARQAGEVEPLAKPLSERTIRPMARALGRAAAALVPHRLLETLRLRIRRAGLTGRVEPSGLVVAAVAFAAIGLAVALWLVGEAGVAGGLWVLVIPGSAAGGFALPFVWLGGKVERRQQAIRRALPDALDMLMISVEAGLGFDAAVSKLVASSDGPLTEEFGVMLGEIGVGVARADAFRHLVERTSVPELETFALAMLQADLLGVSVSQVLRTQSHEMRIRRRQHAEAIAQKAPAKMVFPLVLFILPATMIVLMGPAVIAVMRAFG